MRRIAVLLLAVAAAAVAVAATCPADVAYRWLAPRLAPLQLRGLSGTLWRGHADSADVSGRALGALDWRVPPTSVLRGRPAAQLAFSGAGPRGEGRIERLANGTLALRDAHLHLPAQAAAPALGIPALNLLGTIDVDIEHADFTAAWPGDVAGRARWRDAAVAGAAQSRLGEIDAVFASAADGLIHGTVRDAGGALVLSGTFEAGRARYRAQARLAARGGNPQLVEALQYIGQPQPDGARELLIEGRALPLF